MIHKSSHKNIAENIIKLCGKGLKRNFEPFLFCRLFGIIITAVSYAVCAGSGKDGTRMGIKNDLYAALAESMLERH